MIMQYHAYVQISFEQSPRRRWTERDSGDPKSPALGRSRAGSELSICSNSSARAMQDFLAYGIGSNGGSLTAGLSETPVKIYKEWASTVKSKGFPHFFWLWDEKGGRNDRITTGWKGNRNILEHSEEGKGA